MQPSLFGLLGLSLAPLVALPAATAPAPAKPNLVFILADDLGAGDVRCFSPAGKIATPHLDALAARGLWFTEPKNSALLC